MKAYLQQERPKHMGDSMLGRNLKHERLTQITGAGSRETHLRDLEEHTRKSPRLW